MNTCYELTIKDATQLKRFYMPFIKDGAMFIPTKNKLELNTQVTLKLNIPGEAETFFVNGPVVWINPAYAQNGRIQGIGVRFQNKEAKILKEKIEVILTNINFSDSHTEIHTETL
jgi:type IV pilus assembly protein PilZ